MPAAKLSLKRRIEQAKTTADTKLIQRLATDKLAFIRFALCSNPNTPAQSLSVLAQDRSWQSRCAQLVAYHPNCDRSLQAQLSQHRNTLVRLYLAARRDLSSQAIRQLAQDSDIEVRVSIAQQYQLPSEVQLQLCQDDAVEVRAMLAQNPICSKAVSRRLLNDVDSRVQLYAMELDNVDSEQIFKLCHHPDEVVRKAACRHPLVSTEQLSHLVEDPLLATAIAKHPNSDQLLLTQLSHSDNQKVRQAIAENNAAPAEVLLQLANDNDLFTRLRVANNQQTPPAALYKLAADQEAQLRYQVVINPSCPRDLLKQLLWDSSPLVQHATRYRLQHAVK